MTILDIDFILTIEQVPIVYLLLAIKGGFMYKTLLKSAIISLLCLESLRLAIPAQAGPEHMRPVYDAWNRFTLNNQQKFNSLSPRWQNLVRAVGQVCTNYQRNTGYALYPNQENTLQVMRIIGATASEYQIVYNAIHDNYLLVQMNNDLDRGMQQTGRFIQCLSSGRLNCIPGGF